MKSLKSFLTEYLTDDQRAKYKDVIMSSDARKATDHFFGAGNDHVKEDVIGLEPDKSEVHRAVERHLGKQIAPNEYVKGLTKDQHGRDVRLGRLIRDDKLRNQFANDNARAGSKKSSGHYMTIVRGTEVAGQTNSQPNAQHPNGHSWGDHSCKNIDTGIYKHVLENEIHHGTVVVRAHDHTGQEIYRATLQPHLNTKGNHAYAVDSEYGLKHPAFTAHAHDVAQRLSGSPNMNDPIHRKSDYVYNDNNQHFILHPNLTAEHLTQLENHPSKEIQWRSTGLIPHHPNVTSEHLDRLMYHGDHRVREAVASSPRAEQFHLDSLLADKDPNVIITATKNPNMSDSSLTHILSNKLQNSSADDIHRMNGAAANPSLRAHHFEILKNHDSLTHYQAKKEAAGNHVATEDYLLHCLDKQHPSQISINAANNPSASKKVLSKALDHSNMFVRLTAVENPKMNHELLHKALNDRDSDVKQRALEHPRITNDHISKALDDHDLDVVRAAVKHPNISKENLQKALNHPKTSVVLAAMNSDAYSKHFSGQ